VGWRVALKIVTAGIGCNSDVTIPGKHRSNLKASTTRVNRKLIVSNVGRYRIFKMVINYGTCNTVVRIISRCSCCTVDENGLDTKNHRRFCGVGFNPSCFWLTYVPFSGKLVYLHGTLAGNIIKYLVTLRRGICEG